MKSPLSFVRPHPDIQKTLTDILKPLLTRSFPIRQLLMRTIRAILPKVATVILLATSTAVAQSPGVQSVAERELRKREMLSEFAQNALANGNQAMIDQDYESAYAYYKAAVDSLPSGGEATSPLRTEALDGFSRAVVKLAEQRVSEGRFEDATTTVEVILDERYNPNYGPALSLRSKLLAPDTFNKTLTPGFVADVEEVKQLFREAEGFYQSGRYDLAFKRCEMILNIDKYNIAARRMMEQVNDARSEYQDAAYNQTRAELLSEVEGAWELPVARFDVGTSQILEQPVIDTRGTANIDRKLEEIRIPSINFREATVREALDFVKQRAAALDTGEPDPAKRGVNIVLKLDPQTQAAESGTRITLSLTDVPLGDALRFIAQAANLKLKIEPYAVAVVPLTEPTDVLITKEYRVQPGFISQIPASADTGGTTGGFGAPQATVSRSGAKEFLEAQGVTFPQGATANFLPSSSKLIVRNTQANLDLIDQLVDITNTQAPSQVEIEAKFVEISQNNLKELGFDWLLGQFALPFGTGVYGGGGTPPFGEQIQGTVSQTGSNGNITTSNIAYPFQAPGSAGVPIGATSTTSGPLTGGNRSGTSAISVNALDGLLFAGPAGPAPGVLALAGIFTNPQFQVVLRALDQQKGVDLLSAPRVTTKSGQRAVIQLVREFRYPTQFTPPQIPQSTGSGFTPITPTTPDTFETRNLGIELEVEPTVGPDGYTIELNLSPRVTEFDGFVNYGSPIDTVAQSVIGVIPTVGGGDPLLLLGQARTIRLSENTINQPIFSVREVTTQVSIYDGQTVVLGGLMREDVQKVEDKTPLLGDIPLVGRLFRSSADQHIKRNLIMFVTAALLDPAGQPLIQTDVEGELLAEPDPGIIESEAIYGDPLTAPSF